MFVGLALVLQTPTDRYGNNVYFCIALSYIAGVVVNGIADCCGMYFN